MEDEMHSRPFLLLKRDLLELERSPLTGIDAKPIKSENAEEADLFQWVVRIKGSKGTIWEGGVFQLRLSFTNQYNATPPVVHFMTIPFHPNIDPDNGLPFLHLLKEGWNEDCSISKLLLALQSLLSSPDLNESSVLNPAALKLYRDSPHTYRQLALDCVTASLRVDAGLPPYETIEQDKDSIRDGATTRSSMSTPFSRRPRSRNKRMKQISFDDYHILWKGLATSVPVYSTDKDSTSKQTSIEADRHTQQDLEQKMKEHVVLKYGKPNVPTAKQRTLLSEESRRKRVAELSKMYRLGKARGDKGDSEDEVDALVEWTNKLDETDLVM